MCAMLSPILCCVKILSAPTAKACGVLQRQHAFAVGGVSLPVPSGDPRKHGTQLEDFEGLTVDSRKRSECSLRSRPNHAWRVLPVFQPPPVVLGRRFAEVPVAVFPLQLHRPPAE